MIPPKRSIFETDPTEREFRLRLEKLQIFSCLTMKKKIMDFIALWSNGWSTNVPPWSFQERETTQTENDGATHAEFSSISIAMKAISSSESLQVGSELRSSVMGFWASVFISEGRTVDWGTSQTGFPRDLAWTTGCLRTPIPSDFCFRCSFLRGRFRYGFEARLLDLNGFLRLI